MKNIAEYENLVRTVPDLERKGAKMPYTSLNGHMFSFLDPAGSLGLRLPEGKREEFLTKYRTSLCVAHGTTLKEYVQVPDRLLKDLKVLRPIFKASYEYVRSLKPKPTTRKK